MRIHGNQLLYQGPGSSPYRPDEEDGAGSVWPAALAWLSGALTDWRERRARHVRIRRTTFELARFDDRMLADIGISRLDIVAAIGGAPLRERRLPAEPRWG